MTDDGAAEPVVIAIRVEDPILADRLAALLSEVSGLRLACADEAVGLAVVSLPAASATGELDVALTSRELEVLSLVAEGASNKSIGRHLGISVHTAKFHVGSLLDKLEATGRTDAVTNAARLGVIQL